jgi:hypothetical protein
MKAESCLAAILLGFLAACPSAARKWTDNTGNFSVEADLEELREDDVVLRKTDGTLIAVPKERLSTADRRYLASLAASAEAEARRDKAGRRTPDPGDESSQPRVGRQAIERALGLPTSYAFVEVPLSHALNQLTDQHQVELYVDARALADASIPRNLPLSAEGEDEPLAKALDSVLAPFDLRWTIRDDVLFITSEEAERSYLEAKVYALRQPVPNVDRLVNQLEQKIKPSSWDRVGGPGSIVPWPGGALVVAQTYSLHRELETQFGRMLRPVVHPDPKPTQPPRRGRATPLEALRQASTCEFLDTPLEEAADFLAAQHNIEVRLDKQALADVGIAADVPITLKLGPVPLESTLALLLRPLDLTWIIRDDGLVITTPEAAEQALMTVDYNVRDLLVATGGNVAPLMKVIFSTIAPASWDEVGGRGSLAPVPGAGNLRVRQTFQVHRQIERLLNDLRRIRQR